MGEQWTSQEIQRETAVYESLEAQESISDIIARRTQKERGFKIK